jgi:hypothetical protein
MPQNKLNKLQWQLARLRQQGISLRAAILLLRLMV